MGACLACLAFDACSCLACCACSTIKASLPQCTRFWHFSIIFIIFFTAIILGTYFPDSFNNEYSHLTGIKISNGCDSAFMNDCIYRHLIYRASFACTILSLILSFVASSDLMNKNLMFLKLLIGGGLFIAFWWVDTPVFDEWVNITRFVSILWLITQNLIILDFAHDIHDVLISATNNSSNDAYDEDDGSSISRGAFTGYILFTLAALVAVIIGMIYLFSDYVGCQLGLFFVIFTLIFGTLAFFISLLDNVNKGMLTPLIMFAYTTFLCWYALQSSTDSKCNPHANDNTSDGRLTSLIVVCIISLAVSLYIIINGSIILNIFNPNAEGVLKSSAMGEYYQSAPIDTETGGIESSNNKPTPDADDSSGTSYERVLFQIVVACLSCYAAMILTGWGESNGEPDGTGSGVAANQAMWIKISCQWLFMLMQAKALHVAFSDNAEVGSSTLV